MKGNKSDVVYWVVKFHSRRESINIDKFKFGNIVDFIDLYIFKGHFFYKMGSWIYLFSKKRRMNICISKNYQKHGFHGMDNIERETLLIQDAECVPEYFFRGTEYSNENKSSK